MDNLDNEQQSVYTVLVTGANSGLGFSTCCRLIDEFLHSRPQTQTLHLIITTRSSSKNKDTQTRLSAHLQKTLQKADKSTPGISKVLAPRIRISGEQVDLCNLRSVKELGEKLVQAGNRIDVLVCNAGIGGWKGLNWPSAVWSMMTDWKHSCTYPTYKLGFVGSVAVQGNEEKDQQLGEVFTANVFGHYLLAHALAPLMKGTESQEPGRIIWISSIEAYAHAFNPEDLQALTSDAAYESSKRLTDLLVLTSELPSTASSTSTFLQEKGDDKHKKPIMYLAHPGVCATSIADLPLVLWYAMLFAQYVARWLGSPWHPVSSYLGAVSSVWLSLAPFSSLAQQESTEGKAKWASSTDVFGNERVVRTEVGGWGWGGKVGEQADGKMRLSANRWRGQKDLTKESREEFEVLGQRVWREMEELRKTWEKRLQG
ncbi:3-ketosteroid reductase-like protein, partial [Aureobasidium melanogenum]|uniref:3-ketosteroid reductase-like protein n=1 Tax=Aureobasidium melanogenum (strain CBS 110374) TaxID=1043003 RepID=A0A074WJW3_AURM1